MLRDLEANAPTDSSDARHRTSGEHSAIKEAIECWRNVLGSDGITSDNECLSEVCTSTVGVRRQVPAILYPSDEEQVRDVVRIANRFRTPLYPVSTGRNWGYGDSSPAVDGCTVVNLSRMNRVLNVSSCTTHATVTIQPGVTQKILYDFLCEHALPFLTPVHGGGPDCSIIGNALERGFGITPITNHFDAITSMRAVVGDGSFHESYFEAIGATAIGDRRKSQIGLDVDGLFAQSNFGIVTMAKVRLRRIPRRIAVVFFEINSPGALETIVPQIEEILLEHFPKTLGAINLMNRLRVLAMVAPYPNSLAKTSTMSDRELEYLGDQYNVPEWLGVLTLYGENSNAIRTAYHSIRKHLRRSADRITYCNGLRLSLASCASGFLPHRRAERLREDIKRVRSLLDIATGKPSRVALGLTRWRRSSEKFSCGEVANPHADGCGIIWYSPYVPIVAEYITAFRNLINDTCRKYNIEPLLTFTTVDEQTFDSTIPLLFNRSDAAETEAAWACYCELLQRGKEIGVVPYRYSIGQMPFYPSNDHLKHRIHQAIKKELDPNGIIAPGRYDNTICSR